MKIRDRHWQVIIFLICLIFIALRIWRLTDSCLWFDEIFSIHAAELPFTESIWFIAQDLIHPPLFYILLKFWILIGGENLLWLRLFPVFFAVLSLIPFYLICRELRLKYETTAIALTLFTICGLVIKYSQEVRMYSVLMFLTLVSVWLFVRFKNTGKGIIPLIFINIFLLYAHYFGGLIVFTEVLAIAILAREKIKPILVMFGLTLIGFLPWIYAVWQASKINANVGQNIGWMKKPGIQSLLQFIAELHQPFYSKQSNLFTVQDLINYLIVFLFILICIAAFALYFSEPKQENKRQKDDLSLLGLFVSVPVFIAFAFSWLLPYSVWGTRHLILIFPLYFIILAIALSNLNNKKIENIFLTVLLLFSLTAFGFYAFLRTPTYIWCAWETFAENLENNSKLLNKPQKVYAFEDLNAYHLWFALRKKENFEVDKIIGIPEIIEDKAYFLPRGFEEIKIVDQININDRSILIAFRATELDNTKQPLKTFIERGYEIKNIETFQAQSGSGFLVELEK